MAVQVEVIVATAGILLTHRTGGITADDVAHEVVFCPVVPRGHPVIILRGSQINLVKFLDAFGLEQGIFEFSFPVFIAEKQTERMLRVLIVSAPTAPDTQAGIDVKPF